MALRENCICGRKHDVYAQLDNAVEGVAMEVYRGCHRSTVFSTSLFLCFSLFLN